MRVLVVTSRFPLPAWRGNQVRTLEWLAALSGHERVLVAPEGPPERQAELAATGVRLVPYRLRPPARLAGLARAAVRGLPLQEGLYAVGGAFEAVRGELTRAPLAVVVVQMLRCGWAADLVERHAPGVPIVFDAIDAMGAHFERAAASLPPVMRRAALLEAGRCRRRERWLVERAAVTTAVARRDVDALGVPAARGRVVPVGGIAPTTPRQDGSGPTVLLSGNLGYRPTVEAAQWFATEVWPRLRGLVPQARWVLAGARPARAVRAMGGSDGIEVHADVPDLAPFLATATVAVAPMRTGSGVPIKVLEAWAAGVPVVASRWTVSGLEESCQDAVAVAEGGQQWAEKLASLLLDRAAAAELAERGRQAWERCYYPQRVADAIRAAVAAAVS